MDIRGLVLVNSEDGATEEYLPLSSFPLALLETAGESALQRIADCLRQYGIQSVTAVVEWELAAQPRCLNTQGVQCVATTRQRFWRAAENEFNEMIQDGAELVVLIRLGAYAEVNFEELVEFHLSQGARVTQVYHQSGPLEIFCISASRRNDAASLLRTKLAKCRSECPAFAHRGYINPLQDPRDLRQLAIDILLRQTATRPTGKEVRPGIWIEAGAILEKGARVLAPAFIGASARISSGAVITRCSTVEHHAHVDCGTMVENSTVLPFSFVGAGLDLAHSIAGMKRIVNLRRNASIEVADPKLVGLVSAKLGQRLLMALAKFVTYIPRKIWQGLFGKPQPQQPDLQTALRQTSPSLGNAAGYQAPACNTDSASEFPANLAIVRRYGHQ
jgi:hypothetical protein